MKFTRNLSYWKRVAYVALGGGILCAGLFFVKMPLLVCVLMLAGLVAFFGLAGFCPLCHSATRSRS